MRRFALFAVGVALLGCAGSDERGPNTETVGLYPDRVVLPVSQILTPTGKQVVLPKVRPQAIALSPNGEILVTSGKTKEVIVLDPSSGEILQRADLPPEGPVTSDPGAPSSHNISAKEDKDSQLSFTGLVFSPQGDRLYLSNVQGSVKVFAVEGKTLRGVGSIALPETGLTRRKSEIPAGLAVAPDGKRLFVVLNLSNRLLEVEVPSGKLLRSFDVGVAPHEVLLVGEKAYVSNRGGRRPDATSETGPAGQGTTVRVDPVRKIAEEGTVTVIDLESGKTLKEIFTRSHASAMALSPDQRTLWVANAADDSITAIDTRTDLYSGGFSLRWKKSDRYGVTPNAIAADPSGKRLFVSHGTQNCVSVVSLDGAEPRITGLIPVGWFPGALALDTRRGTLHVANIKGVGSHGRALEGTAPKSNSHEHNGSVSLVPLPSAKDLERHTAVVLRNYRREIVEASQLAPRAGVPPRPVPERVGEPSVFKHVVYIVKENRTYDQVFGDVKEGNGDPSICIFPEEVTPNQHKIAREWVLLDNTYCSGVLSADGHQWAMTGITTDYIERSFAGWPRSYPDGMDDDDVDALAYAPSGFLWDQALAFGKTLRVYGEFAIPTIGWKDAARKPKASWIDYYRDFTAGTGLTTVESKPSIESLRPYLKLDTVGWTMDVPDVLRAQRFIEELHEFERKGEMPALVIICLPNDHTSGTKEGMPTPAAHVADNDLAFGRIVEAISKSRFWPETCILSIEDDPQDGFDHVSAYRTTAYVVSPYTKRGTVIHTQYNQPGLLRTIGLILGMPPLNQMDAAATPLTDCFLETPDLRPYDTVPNRVPLDQLNPPAQAIASPLLRENAVVSATLPLDRIDACPEGVLNRILWHAQKGPDAPYPAWAERPRDARRDDD